MKTNKIRLKVNPMFFTVCLLTAMLLLPAAAPASQKGWATVGKVLTGLTAANILLEATASSHQCRPRLARSEIIHHYYPASEVVIYEHTVIHRPSVVNTHIQTTGRKPYSRHYHPYSHRYHRPAPVCRGPIIRYQGRSRRIVQPRIRGHIAELQVYRRGAWITISTHPSIW